MKKIKWMATGVLLWVFGCTSDNLEEFYEVSECSEISASFKDDIMPIIETNCLLSGCHGDNPSLPDWGDFSVLQAKAEKVKLYTGNGIMPPSSSGKSLTAEEVQKISCWVDSGAPNN